MAVITISRGSFSGGKMLAEALGRKLGYRCIDRDLIVDKAAAFGVSEVDLRACLEKPPASPEEARHTRYIYLAVIQAALVEEVRSGKAIYHGLAGHLLLKDARHVLRTRLIAPMEFRVAMVQDRLKLARKEAVEHIHRMDQDRRKWTKFLYGVNWEDPSLYDVVLNLDHLNIDQAAEFICAMLKERPFAITPEHHRAMNDLAIACRIRANLAINPSTADLEPQIEVHGASVAIKGQIQVAEQLKEISRIAKAVRGVADVHVGELVLAAKA